MKVKVSKEEPEVNIIQETEEMDIDLIQPLLTPSSEDKEEDSDTTSDINQKESLTEESAAGEKSEVLSDLKNDVVTENKSELTDTTDKDKTEEEHLKESMNKDAINMETKDDLVTSDAKEVASCVDELNSSLASSTADSDISGITELDNKSSELIVEENMDKDNTIDDLKDNTTDDLKDLEVFKKEETEVKFTEIEVRSRVLDIDDNYVDDNIKEDDLDTNVPNNDEDGGETKVSPDNNKENKSESKQNIMDLPRPALKEKKKVVIQSRVSRIINMSR